MALQWDQMADETKKQCPQCNGQIDFFGSCRKCGRQWSEDLELGEKAFGLPEGEQYKSVVKKNRHTHSS